MEKKEFPTIDPHTIFSEEKNYDDDIFYAPAKAVGYGNSVNNDIDYDNHDYSLQIFSTMKDNTFYAIHSNNLITPIRKKPELSFFGKKHNFSKISNKKRNTEGVYIVQIISINTRQDIDYKMIINHYLNSDTFDVSDDLMVKIREKIEQIKNNKRTTGPFKLRFVSYIPDYELYNYMSVYVENANIVITCKDIHETFHPHSTIFNKEKRRVTCIDQNIENFISLEVIDNSTPGKPYYINYGNWVERIESKKDVNKKPGAYLTIKKDGIVTRNDIISKEEFTDIGLHDDINTAKFGLDPSNEITKLKLELDRERIVHERNKLNIEARLTSLKYANEVKTYHMKMQHEKVLHNHKVKISDIEHRRTMDKLNIDLDKKNSNGGMMNDIAKGTDIAAKLTNVIIAMYKLVI